MDKSSEAVSAEDLPADIYSPVFIHTLGPSDQGRLFTAELNAGYAVGMDAGACI